MEQVILELSKKELFILDHALRYRLKRVNAKEWEQKEENELLDKVNNGIRKLNK